MSVAAVLPVGPVVRFEGRPGGSNGGIDAPALGLGPDGFSRACERENVWMEIPHPTT